MKTSTILLFLNIALFATTGCKKEGSSTPIPCVWDTALLKSKTFKITKIIKVDNGVTTDETPASSCLEFKFGDGTENVVATPPCTGNQTISYSASTDNGVNYLNQKLSGSTTTEKTVISSFGCNSYIEFRDYGGGTTQYVTYTKQ